MKFKIGIALILFGILISNGAVFDIGSFLYIAGGIIGAIGLCLAISESDDSEHDDSKHDDKEQK